MCSRISFAILLISIFTSCASCRYESIEIKDSRWCIDEGRLGFYCRWIISKKEERFARDKFVTTGSIVTDANGVAEFQKVLKKACEKMRCSIKEELAIKVFFDSVNGLRGNK